MIKKFDLLMLAVLILTGIGHAESKAPRNINLYIEITNPSEEQSNKFYDDVTSWAETDLKSATDWAYDLQRKKGENDLTASTATLGVIRAATKRGPEKTFEWIKANSRNKQERLDAISSLIVVEAFLKEPLIKIAEAGNEAFERNADENIYIAQSFFNKVPLDQEEDVIKYGQKINDPSGLYKSAILGPVLKATAQKDFEKASKIWSDLDDGNSKDLIFTTSIEEYLLKMAPEETIKWLNAHKISSLQRGLVEGKFFGAWYVSEQEAATQYFVMRMKTAQPGDVLNFISAVEKVKPQQAMEFLSKIEDPNLRDLYLQIYAANQKEKNPKQFQNAMRSSSNQIVNQAVRRGEFDQLFQNDPKKACLYYQQLPENEKESIKVLYWLSCVKWYEADQKEFMVWARTLKKSEYDPIVGFLDSTSKKFANDSNAKYVAEEMAHGQKRDETLNRIIQQKAMQNPEDALAWAFNLKNEKEKIQAIQQILLMWSVTNSAATCDWITDNIKQYPEELESSLSGPFFLLSNKDKKTAIEKSKKIQNPKLRQLVIIGLQLSR
jgi:hypothetical protein